MKKLLTLILLFAGAVQAQVTPTLPSGATSYSSQIYRKIAGTDTTYYTGASGKGFLKLGGYADVLRLQDSIDGKVPYLNATQDLVTPHAIRLRDSLEVKTYGGISKFIGKRYGGSFGSPTAVGSGETLSVFGARAYDGVDANGYSGSIEFNSVGTQSSTNNGTSFDLFLTPRDSSKIRKNLISANFDLLMLGINTPTSFPRVAIGTRITNPGSFLHKFQVVSEGINPTVMMGNYGVNDGAGNAGGHWFAARGTHAFPLPLLSGDYLWSNGFRGWAPSGLQTSSASFYARAVEDFTNTTHGTELGFMTTKIGANANVGRTHTFLMGSDGIFNAPGFKQDSVLSALAYMDGTGRLRAATSGTDFTLLNGTGIVEMAGTTPSYLSSIGTGNVVRATSPTLVTPIIGAAVGSSLLLNTSGLTLSNAGLNPVRWGYNSGQANSRSWQAINDINTFGDFGIQQSTTQAGSTFADALYFSPFRVATFSADVNVPDEVFGADWNGSTEVPTKNAVYDKISSFSSGMTFKGAWNAATNTPTLADGVGTLGDMYTVQTGGTVLGRTYVTGGQAIYDGSIWVNQGTTSAVSSVNGNVGAIQLNPSISGDIISITGGTATADISGATSITNKLPLTGGNLSGNLSIGMTGGPSRLNVRGSVNDSGFEIDNQAAGTYSLSYDRVAAAYKQHEYVALNHRFSTNTLTGALDIDNIGQIYAPGTNAWTSGTRYLLSLKASGGMVEFNLPSDVKTMLDLSGTNTGDNATNTTSNAYADAKVENNLTASTTVAPSKTAVNTALALKQDALGYTPTSITGLTGIQSASAIKTGLSLVKGDVGLGNVDNTSDATKNSASATLTNKTISGSANTISNIAQSSVTSLTSDLALKAPLASPALTGTPTAPTASAGTNNTQIATTAYVDKFNLTSGVYTPTITSVSNVASVSGTNAHYKRVGNEVFVQGRSVISTTLGDGSDATFTITLPIASAMTTSADATGSTIVFHPLATNGEILGEPIGDTVQCTISSSTTASITISFSFTYTVK